MDIISLCAIALLSFGFAALSGHVIIPALKRLKVGQTISQYVKEHQGKANTPTMGGIIFIIPAVLCSLLALFVAPVLGFDSDGDSYKRLFTSVIMILAMTGVGFIDDYIKVVKKRNVGLTEIQKTLLQSVITIAYLVTLTLIGNVSTSLLIPFTQISIDLGVFWYPIMFIAVYGFVNAVNITDGIDGLCASVTLVACCFFIPVAVAFGVSEHAFLAAATAGGLAGFLVWNFYPAKVFMGDTGSMFLGAAFVALAFSVGMPLVTLPVGLIYFIEIFSDVIQIAVYKLSHGKKKAFKMAPIHHHYQLSGWSEIKIVFVFSGITLIMCVATLLWIFGAFLS